MALAYRGIPLQAPYCAAKHAIQGFDDSLRADLHHAGSRIRVNSVHLPALNTTQFTWVRTRLPRHPQPVRPICQPDDRDDAGAHGPFHRRARRHSRQLWAATTAPAGGRAGRVLARRAAAR